MWELLGFGFTGLLGTVGCSPSESLVAWGGGGFRVTLAGLNLGVGSGLGSSTVGWISGLAAGKSYRYS